MATAIRHNVELKDIDYVQIHPTTFYSEKEEDRSFLISESVRGEGALLYDKDKERFTEELLPRDLLTNEIKKQMKKDGTNHVWLSMKPIEKEQLTTHFPNIVEHCREQGYNVPDEMIPVVPAQHYFMGGIKVNLQSKTSMDLSLIHICIVGSSNNPVSGMAIATLIITSFILKATGTVGTSGMVAAISIGTVICIIAAMAGDTSQDLKTGYIVGATPMKQQIGELLGAVVAALTIGGVLYLLSNAWGGFGSAQLPAPQASLMKMVVEGVMGGRCV